MVGARRSALDLHEHEVKEVTAFQGVALWFGRVFSNGDEVDDAAPLALVCAPERDELPALCDPSAEGAGHRLDPAARRVGLDVGGCGRECDFRHRGERGHVRYGNQTATKACQTLQMLGPLAGGPLYFLAPRPGLEPGT